MPEPAPSPVIPGEVLLHICCGPCATWPVRQLREAGSRPVGFWYNPNVHPYREYMLRLQSCRAMAAAVGLPLEVRDDYALRDYLTRVLPFGAGPERCSECYRIRLEATARKAQEIGLGAISTTLLVSPYQQHERLAAVARQVAAECGLSFVYQDWRAGFRQGRVESRALGLYHQGYCGCVFSEFERYAPGDKRPVREGRS
ncbi:MAG: epoxyqueuosine reductase QueH [Bacillota bacterium]|nr:epoxyqueuosine reductase QueH [Bacillota bacterium]